MALVADSADLRQEIARGIVRYSHDELAQLTGCQSAEIEARLGYTYGSVAVHRNDLILCDRQLSVDSE